MTITEDYTDWYTSQKLANLGFDETCGALYDTQGTFYLVGDYISTQPKTSLITNFELKRRIGNVDNLPVTAPTLQMAMKWLRKKHDLEIDVTLQSAYLDGRKYYMFKVYNPLDGNVEPLQQCEYKSFEEAAQAAIKYAIDKII